MDYLHTPSSYFSVPYTEDEEEYVAYLTHGKHHGIHKDRAIYWFHSLDPSKRVRIVWLTPEPNGNEERTTPDGSAPELPNPGPRDETISPDDARSVPDDLPAV